MRNRLLVGAGLGLVAAVVFASATTGPLIARFILFFITPLPIALAGLGWGWLAAAVAGAVGMLLLAIGAGIHVALLFALSQVVPMVVLTHLALLSRSGPAGGETIEWYPPGRLVIWAAVLAAVLAFASLMLIGGDLENVRTALGDFIEKTVRNSLPELTNAPLTEVEIKELAEAALWLLPAASAISWMGGLLFNLWLAGRVTLASGQLMRPWPDLAAIEYPRGTSLAFAGSLLALLMTSGHVALAASGIFGALFLAYMLLGLAIIHYTTRGAAWRPFALWALYAALLFLNMWIGVLAAILGLSESIFGLRRRYPPPSGPST
jgi:hypothetical protein